MRATSGPLEFHEAKGVLVVDAEWWVDTGITDAAFQLRDHACKLIGDLDSNGRLRALPGYLWDGSSRPLIKDQDDEDAAPSLAHDLLYEAIRTGHLHPSMRGPADGVYRDMLRERDYNVVYAWWRWFWVRVGGVRAGSPRRGPEYPRRVAR